MQMLRLERYVDPNNESDAPISNFPICCHGMDMNVSLSLSLKRNFSDAP